jgi:hypothetical protein
MKRFLFCLLLGAIAATFCGCASEGYHTPGQMAAQRSTYDETRHTRGYY